MLGARVLFIGVAMVTIASCASASRAHRSPAPRSGTTAPSIATTTSFVDLNGTVPNPELSQPFPADWVLDPAFPLSPASTSLHVMVTEIQCASGLDPTDRIDATVSDTPAEVRLSVIVNSVGGAASCQGNPPTPYVIELSQPLGDRDIVDDETSITRAVSVSGMTFVLPPELRFHSDGFVSTGEAIDGFYANVPIGPSCTDGCGIGVFTSLPPGAVVVGFGVLSGFGAGAPSPSDPSPNTSIAGRVATFTVQKPAECHGDESIKAWIPDSANSDMNDFLFRACLQGPDLTAGERLVDALLSSAHAA